MPRNARRAVDRQLARLALDADTPPDLDGWRAFLAAVEHSYTASDQQLYLLERSLEVSSTEMRALHDVLSHQATHDALTGLPNRSAFTSALTQQLTRSRSEVLAVLFIDLDGFKRVNDTWGHPIGDHLLVAAAERITSSVRQGDTVARLAGDEFVVLCCDVAEPDDVLAMAHRLVADLSAPFSPGGHRVHVSASVGVAFSRPDLDDDDAEIAAANLLRRADAAMYEAKARGKDQVVRHDDEIGGRTAHLADLEQALHTALDDDELVVLYQPVVHLRERRVSGCEAQLHWQRPGRGLVPPQEFIAVASRSRLICALDAWLARRVCADLPGWPDALQIGINLTARDLENEDLVDIVEAALRQAGVPGNRLVIEVAERAVTDETGRITRTVRRLHDLGTSFLVDNFGVGQSSLSTLRDLGARWVKVDSSLTAGVDSSASDALVVGAVVQMCHALGIPVIADGVERLSQLDRLVELGCDGAQGPLIAPALRADELSRFLAEQAAVPAGVGDLPTQSRTRSAVGLA